MDFTLTGDFLYLKGLILSDNRIHTMNEVKSGVRIIKMYALEKGFTALVPDIRR